MGVISDNQSLFIVDLISKIPLESLLISPSHNHHPHPGHHLDHINLLQELSAAALALLSCPPHQIHTLTILQIAACVSSFTCISCQLPAEAAQRIRTALRIKTTILTVALQKQLPAPHSLDLSNNSPNTSLGHQPSFCLSVKNKLGSSCFKAYT